MGNCCSLARDGSSYEREADSPATSPNKTWSSPFAAPKLQQVPLSARDKQQREKTWKATGLIALRDANLQALPENIANVALDAKVLDAHGNALKHPSSIAILSQCVNLQRLVLSKNQLTTLPADVIKPLVNLKYLVLDHNKLTNLPEEVGGLEKLELLSVCNNSLQVLPNSISRCLKLRKLLCKDNQLASLPDHLPEELEEIDATQNQLVAIPMGVSLLKKLTTLKLDSNNIPAVPAEVLVECVLLHTLTLHQNPITPDQLQSTPGFEAFERRRRQKYDKVIGGGAMIATSGLDEGVDRKV